MTVLPNKLFLWAKLLSWSKVIKKSKNKYVTKTTFSVLISILNILNYSLKTHISFVLSPSKKYNTELK